MIKEAYCSFEVAKLLKDKGFDEKCVAYYPQHITPIKLTFGGRVNYNAPNKFKMLPPISAPTHQMAMAWLREKHHIHIDVIIQGNGSCIEYVYAIRDFSIIFPTRNYDSIDIKFKGRTDTYEEAVEASLKYSLENLI